MNNPNFSPKKIIQSQNRPELWHSGWPFYTHWYRFEWYIGIGSNAIAVPLSYQNSQKGH